MSDASSRVSGTAPGQRLLNGPQTSGREYRNLSEPTHAFVRDDELSVNDGEWVTRSQYVGSTDANGDSGPCWIDAPAAVPSYLSYLQQLGVGMAVWTLSDGAPGFGITAASDPGTFTTTATMDQWPGCVNVNPTRGPGALIMAWFKKAG